MRPTISKKSGEKELSKGPLGIVTSYSNETVFTFSKLL